MKDYNLSFKILLVLWIALLIATPILYWFYPVHPTLAFIWGANDAFWTLFCCKRLDIF